jgi:gluconokinase
VRAALFDEQGDEIEGAQVRSRRTAVALSDFAELDADTIVDEVVETIDELLVSSSHIAGEIELIAISTFWHSLIGVNGEGQPTTSLLTWADTRAAQQAKRLKEKFDEREVHARTGCRFHPSYWPAKLQWLKDERAVQFNETCQWLGFAEYLCLRLFGETQVSVSMASATGIFNQGLCEWDWELVRALDISAAALPKIQTEEMPQLTNAFAARWPALARARLASVIGDGAANNIGGGCSTKEKLALMVGTSGAMRVAFTGEPPSELPPALWSYRANRNVVVVGGALSDGGGLYRWLTESMNVDDDPSELSKKVEALEPDSHGLTILPFWSGERSTRWSADARGAIFGLTQQTRPVEVIRAALEAIAYRFALIARALEGIAPGATVVATGNALRSSPVWLQIFADVLGRPVMFGGSPEASIRGAALLALEAVGKIRTIQEVPTPVDEAFEPNMGRHARYQEGLERQEELYDRLLNDHQATN